MAAGVFRPISVHRLRYSLKVVDLGSVNISELDDKASLNEEMLERTDIMVESRKSWEINFEYHQRITKACVEITSYERNDTSDT